MATPDGVLTPVCIARWKAKGGRFTPQAGVAYLEDKKATTALRALWRASFPARLPLPMTEIVTDEGTFTDDMLNVWL